MNHLLNFGIIFCLLLPFVNDSAWHSNSSEMSDIEKLSLLSTQKSISSNLDSINTEILKIESKIAQDEIKPVVLKWFEHCTEIKNVWFGFQILIFPPILFFFVLGLSNIVLAFKSDVKNTLHKTILWLIPICLLSLLILENPYELMIGYWLALILSSFKVFRIYYA